MNEESNKPGYLLLFRGADWDRGLSPEEIQKVMLQTTAWLERLGKSGKVKSGHPLLAGGTGVSKKKGQMVADGPFAESKETIGGYLLLNVANLNEALEIAKNAPELDYGLTIEVHEIAEECPTMQRARASLTEAAA